MTLRRRLTLTATVGTAAFVAVVSAVFLVALRNGLTGNLDAALTTRTAEVVAELRERPGGTVTTEGSNGILVQILAPDGRVVDGSDQLGVQRLLTGADLARATRGHVARDTSVTAAVPGADVSGPVRVVGVPGPGGVVVAAAETRAALDATVLRTGWLLLGVAVVLGLAAAAGSWLLARAALRPVDAMRAEVAALATDDPTPTIAVPEGDDELSRLAETFNALLARLAVAIGRERSFVADAGHELRNPLTVLRGELELAGRPGRSAGDLRATIATAAAETDRLVDLAENLLELARDPGLGATTDVDAVAVALAAAAAARAGGTTVTVTSVGGPGLVVAEPTAVRRALDNVLDNAARHAPQAAVEVAVAVTSRRCTVVVRDHGPGFADGFLPRAFDRFSQSDPGRDRHRAGGRRTGAGLGLAIVAAVMAGQGGTAEVANHPCGGAVVTLTWPTADTPDSRP